VDAADAAFADWAALGPAQRRKIFLTAADLLEARTDEAVRIMAGEVGGTRPWAMFNVGLAANILREAAAAVTAPRGEVLSAQEEGALGLAVREPVGVVAAFSPWNAPVILGVRAVAAPLAAGNTVVMKPSEDAPIACGLFVADVLRDAGCPTASLNVITNAPEDAAAVAEALIADERVRAVNFTGSTGVGRIIGVHAARHLKPAVLELGGKNSVIVLDDADVDYAVNAAVFSVFMNSGQICMSADRILVHESLAEEFTAKFTAKTESLPSGDPADPHTVVGPLVTTDAARRVAALVEDAVAKGATVLTGGAAPEGAVHPATVLTDLPEDADLYHGEAFGPLAVIVHLRHGRRGDRLRQRDGTRAHLRDHHRERHPRAQGRPPDPYRHRAHQRPVRRRRTERPLRRVQGQRLRPLRRAMGHRGVQQHALGDAGDAAGALPVLGGPTNELPGRLPRRHHLPMTTNEALLPPTFATARPVRVQQQSGRPRRLSLPRS
jgi:acyl-CoA reductase-like NAD-dependent aldehyde dehydrogenase